MKAAKLRSSTFLSVIIFVVSIVASILISRHYGDRYSLRYNVDKDKVKIFDTRLSKNPIQLVIRDSLFVSENVYVSTLRIWNSGNRSIDEKTIRTPLSIKLNGKGYIIINQIVDMTSNLIDSLEIQELTDTSHILSWNYFDPGGGVLLQITHTGNDETRLEVSGAIVGSNVIPSPYILTAYDLAGILIAILMGLWGIYNFWVIITDLKTNDSTTVSKAYPPFLALLVILFIGAWGLKILLKWVVSGLNPPI